MDTYEIDQALCDEIHPLVRIVEELFHGDGTGSLLAQHFKIAIVFGSERVLDEERTVLFQLLDQINGFNRWKELMDVMEKFRFVSEFRANEFEHFGDHLHVRPNLHNRVRLLAKISFLEVRPSSGQVRSPVISKLDTNVPETAILKALNTVFQFYEILSSGMAVGIHRESAFPPKELVGGHVGSLSLDVPESLIHTPNAVFRNGPLRQ